MGEHASRPLGEQTGFVAQNLLQFKNPMQQVYAPLQAFIGGCRCIVAQTILCAMVFPVGDRLSRAAIHALTVFYVPLLPKPRNAGAMQGWLSRVMAMNGALLRPPRCAGG